MRELEGLTPEEQRELLLLLRRLAPPVSRWVAKGPAPDENLCFVDLDQVCYITSRVPAGLAGRSLFVLVDGSTYVDNSGLIAIERKLCLPHAEEPGCEGQNPWFLRTHESYLVNLKRVVRFEYAASRTLWFEGHEEPIENAVSDLPLRRDAFDAHFPGI